MKRFGALAMALLIVLAVAGPVCLMFASSAMAMSMEAQSSPCEPDQGSDACPYERPDSTSGVKAPHIDPVAPLAVLAAAGGAGLEAPSHILNAATIILDPPPSHLSPLRI